MADNIIMTIETNETTELVSLFRSLVEAFINYPSDLQIASRDGQFSTTLTVTAHADDQRKVIGQKGIMFRALSTILKLIGGAHKKNIRLIINEPVTGDRQPLVAFHSQDDWDAKKVARLAESVCEKIFNGLCAVQIENVTGTSYVVVNVPKSSVNMPETEEALGCLFDAIGKSIGRILILELRRS
jgi:predicted RNA-binding protein YlqC (UPF0109 family)